ncbi:hypothetical protein RvY_00348 [Ramazzottius varieornatus]|uniref:Uncharacterized protein n=1 Tax=Ramazzottius varieornatus TaxID=947166 RepID=A0A1D1UCX7_RAMVA|nr:hypothetical protein RvY_00348 [Ramazzottius varieornatus]
MADEWPSGPSGPLLVRNSTETVLPERLDGVEERVHTSRQSSNDKVIAGLATIKGRGQRADLG